jgi:hypothetical protein
MPSGNSFMSPFSVIAINLLLRWDIHSCYTFAHSSLFTCPGSGISAG